MIDFEGEATVRRYESDFLYGLTGELFHMGEGKNKESLELFFSLLTDM